MDSVSSEFKQEKLDFEFKGIWPYPVSESWVEIGFGIATFLGGAAAGHYASKLFTMLDVATKSSVTNFNAIIKRGDKETHCDLPRSNKDEAIKLLTEALEKLRDEDGELTLIAG